MRVQCWSRISEDRENLPLLKSSYTRTLAVKWQLLQFCMCDNMAKKKINQSLAEVLIAKIESCGKSRYLISKESGVDSGTLSRFVNGERSITLDVADKICKVIGLQLTDLPSED